MKTVLVTAALAATFSQLALAVRPVNVTGNNFINSVTGDRFVMVGIAYQPAGASGYDPNSGVDPLSDADVCLRDAAVMQRLGINTIRVYNINPSVNHDKCMSIFNAVGVYVALDVNSPLGGESLNRHDPAESYHAGYLKRVFSVVDAFKGYPNLLGLFAGNEVVNDAMSAGLIPPYIRAVQRDLKSYIKKHADRTIPVGYSAADDPTRRPMWAYLSCGDDSDSSRSDFFGLNSYQWCGDSTWETSGYAALVETYKATSIPLFFSEFGCNTVRPRPFGEIDALYGEKMVPSWSGGLVYEYTQETSDYGIIEIKSNGDATLLKDFDNLQQKYNNIDLKLLTTPTGTTVSPPKCDKSFILTGYSGKSFNTSTTSLPAMPSDAKDLLENGSGNKNIGKLVEITDTKTPHKVYATNGNLIKDLAIKPLAEDETNTPSGQNTSSSSNETQSSSGGGDKKGAGSRSTVCLGGTVGLAVVVGLFSFGTML